MDDNVETEDAMVAGECFKNWSSEAAECAICAVADTCEPATEERLSSIGEDEDKPSVITPFDQFISRLEKKFHLVKKADGEKSVLYVFKTDGGRSFAVSRIKKSDDQRLKIWEDGGGTMASPPLKEFKDADGLANRVIGEFG